MLTAKPGVLTHLVPAMPPAEIGRALDLFEFSLNIGRQINPEVTTPVIVVDHSGG